MGPATSVDLDTLMERVRRVAAPPATAEPAASVNGEGRAAGAWTGDAARAQAEFNRGVVEALGSLARLLGQLREETAIAEAHAQAATAAQAETIIAAQAALARLEGAIGGAQAAAAEGLAALEARLRAEAAARQAGLEREFQALARRVDNLAERTEALAARAAPAADTEPRAAACWSRVRALVFRV